MTIVFLGGHTQTYNSWVKPVKHLSKLLGKVTKPQIQLGALSDTTLPRGLPRLVAAARIRTALAFELGFVLPTATGHAALDFLSTLDRKCATQPRVLNDSFEASAWIEFYLLLRRKKSLQKLKLEAGDIVEVNSFKGQRIEEVVSISENGQVHFRGGRGSRAWPDSLSILARKNARGKKAEELRTLVSNQASTRAYENRWSLIKQTELKAFEVKDQLTINDAEQLEQVIDSSTDETAIQKFLESRPQILTALLTGGHGRFSIPHPRLGGSKIPDFLIGDVDSLGIRWILVELESPTANITLTNQNLLAKCARKGVSQVEEWREWIQNNLDFARRSKQKDGLGLIDIRPQSEGLVLVGRRSNLSQNSSAIRHQIRETRAIRVHTYDWLIQQLRGVLTIGGLSGINPYVMQPLREDEDW